MHTRKVIMAAALVLASAAGLEAQNIEQQVRQAGDGTVHLIFASKPGVCGNGRGSISMGGGDHRNHDCWEGPVRVDLDVENGSVVDIETRVGGDGTYAVNTATRAAADYLLGLAEHSPRADVAKAAIFPVLIADSITPWPQLLRIAKNDDLDRDVRKSAIFWLGQAAGDKATEGLKSLLSDDDVEVKKQAVFALSQMGDASSVTALIDVVHNSKDREVRKSALFWLSQSSDPRILALFEDILLK